MNEYIECPYCGWEQETPDDGYSYDVGIHRKECAGCGRSFAYETTISISYEAYAAPCINGDAEHNWRETKTFPRRFRKMRCSVCGEEKEIEGIEEERKAYRAELMQKNDELERKVHQLKRMNNESLDLLAADSVIATAMQNKIEILEQQHAEMLEALEVCKGYFETMGLDADSVTYDFICKAIKAALAAERGRKRK
jgi:hypothetical protein